MFFEQSRYNMACALFILVMAGRLVLLFWSTPEFHMPKINNRVFDNRTVRDDTVMTSLFEGYTFPQPDCSKKLLVYVCSNAFGKCHGLGDRQRGIISSFMLALLTNRTFVIKHTWPCSLSKFFIPNLYDWSKCLRASNNIDDKHVVTFFDGKGNLPKFIELDKGDIWTERLVAIHTNVIINERIREHPSVNDTIPWAIQGDREYITRKLFNTLFQLEKSLKDEIDTFISNITLNGQTILVGVHIRQDYANRVVIEEIFSAMKKYSNKSVYTIYLSTDVHGLRISGTKLFPNCFTLNVSKTVIHVNNRFADCDTFHAAVFEQQVLARADILIKTRSQLSKLAYMIRPNHTLSSLSKYVYEKRVIPELRSELNL